MVICQSSWSVAWNRHTTLLRESEVGMAEPCLDYDLVQNICARKVVPDISSLHFCNPDVFIAGQLHLYDELWERIAALTSSDHADEVLDWIKNKCSLYTFFHPFKGNFKGLSYNSDMPPHTEFDNNKSCNNFLQFIDKTLLAKMCRSTISVLGRVGEVDPPHLVMPLTVGTSKPSSLSW